MALALPRWLDAGALPQTDFADVFAGWNVWSVWQKKDLDFETLMVGVSRDRRLRIWVEDHARLDANANVSDPIDLKGSQVQIIAGATDLKPAATKEGVAGDSALLLDGPAELRFVRFFNHGGETRLPWPHDSNYLLDTVYQPSPTSPATTGEPPPTIGETLGKSVKEPIKSFGEQLLDVAIPFALLGGIVFVGWVAIDSNLGRRATTALRKQGRRASTALEKYTKEKKS